MPNHSPQPRWVVLMEQESVIRLQKELCRLLSHLTGEEVVLSRREALFFASVAWSEYIPTAPESEIIQLIARQGQEG